MYGTYSRLSETKTRCTVYLSFIGQVDQWLSNNLGFVNLKMTENHRLGGKWARAEERDTDYDSG
jgi:hypothetical protein